MTKINKLVMHGFKSFARRTELLFTNEFNCVVGPNGSGKSNILDALCFVLGKSSAKALRSEKSSHLIYNGGKSKKAAEKAEVSIYFDNTSRAFPLDADETKVSRFVSHKGSSTYKINDKTVTRQQVVELLSLAKIDADGHNIILQGDIARFCEMGGEDRRLLIEEIAGISVYEDKKNKAMSELTRVDERLKEAEIILNERGDYLKGLKRERDEAIRYTDVNNKLKTSKASYISKQLERKSSEYQKYDDAIKKHNEVIEAQANKVAELKNAVLKNKTETENINNEIETKGEKEQVSLHKEVEELKVTIATSKNNIESAKNEIVKVKQRKEQLEDNIKEVNEKIKIINSEQSATQKEISIKNKELEQINKKIEELRKKNNLDGAEEIEKKIDALDKSVDENQKIVLDLRQKQQEAIREKDKSEFQIRALDEKMEKMLELEKENKVQLEELKGKKEQFKKATSELNQILNKNSNISAQLGTARGKLNTARDDLSKIEAKLSAIKEVDGAVSQILEQKKKLGGIYGSVSELGKVSSKYSLALEIAAANKIKSVVVDSDSTAQKCIEFLKEKKLGVAHFIPLNKIKGKDITAEERKIASKPGVVGFAIDLVDFDKKYERAFSYVFGSTLVVDNLDVARNIGIGTIKMVTIDGDVSETSGLMSGGFRDKRRGAGFTQSELDDELKKLQAAVGDHESLISRLEKERVETEDQIGKLRTFKANLEGDIIKLEKVLHLQSDDTDASSKVRKEQEALLAKLDKEINKISMDISDINSKMAEAKMEKQELRDKISQIRNPILLAELNTFEQKRSQIKEEVIKLEALMKNFETQIKTMLSPETEKTFNIIKQHDREELEFNENIKKLKETIDTSSKILKEKEVLEEKFMQQFKGLFVKRQKIDKDIAEIEDKIEDASEKMRKAELEVNTVKLESVRISTELDGLKKEFEQYEGVELDTNTPEAELKASISKFETALLRMDSVNMKALEMFDIVEKEFNSLCEKKDGLAKEKEDVLMLINEIETKKIELFTKSFDAVNDQFKKAFSQLTTKGAEAFLKLENPQDPFSAGVDVKVKITGNRFMDIRGLSGGEKTMTALAFIFAIQEYEPASFYILDEVDAALDKANAERLANLVGQYSSKAQYVMISHNDGVIGAAKTLYGVSMDTQGISNVVSLKL
ncbi:chromosome segregation protein SMC [Candidatus Woesearchaeota archaeon]|nr:chromosome segregation protein SMC [Candidatus Woesearchaeota archaeon]